MLFACRSEDEVVWILWWGEAQYSVGLVSRFDRGLACTFNAESDIVVPFVMEHFELG